MSLSASFASALSGLTAASRAAELVSANVANAATPGYGQRELTTASRVIGSVGQGVQVVGVRRLVDQALLADRRLAEAGSAGRAVAAQFYQQLETAIGLPDSDPSLASRIAAFDQALLQAAARPESDAGLLQVANAAAGLVDHLAAADQVIQGAQATATNRIAAETATVNATLLQIAELNGQIRSNAGRDTSALMDQRQVLVDSIATVIPLREVPRDGGQIALISTGGLVLLDGRTAELDLSPNGIMLNGRPVDPGPEGPLAGGSLAAQFALRDVLAPLAQQQLGGLARDMITRFAGPGADPTLADGVQGVFVASGSLMAPGLAGRLAVTPLIDPQQGGALWRLRAGLAASGPGAMGDATVLNGLQAALNAPGQSLSAAAADFASFTATARLSAEGEASFARARSDALHEMELQGGVDTDHELQKLLTIEEAYAANAKVLSILGDMIQTLMEI